MSAKKILGAVLFVAAVALMFVPGGQLGTIAILGAQVSVAAIISTGLMIASSMLLGPSVPKMPGSLANGGRDRLWATLDVRTPRKILFGKTAGATDVRYQTYTGSEQEYVEMIVCVASHKVNSIYELWLDNEKAWTSASGVQGDYSGFLTVTAITLGTNANGIAIDSVWTTSATLTGCAYLHVKAKLTDTGDTTSPFSTGITSRMTIRCEGASVYDPRLDSTVTGGSGAHRADNQSTWAWSANGSRNPALQLLFYLLGWKINSKLALGMGLPKSRIDLPSFITAANICDESITKSAANGGGTEPRYRTDGVLSESDDRNAVVETLCSHMNAILRDAGGKLSLTVLKNDLATPVASFTEEDVIGALQWEQTSSLSSTFNITRGQRIDPSDNALYQPVDYPEIALTSNDGIDRIDTFDVPMCESHGQAVRLAKQRLQRGQYQGRLTLTGKPKWWQVSIGDVIQLTHASPGWINKLFRVAAQRISRTGECEVVMVEENSAIYAWDNDEAAPVAAGTPTVYDVANSPLVKAIEAAAAPTTGNMLTDALFGSKWTLSAGAARKPADATGGYAQGYDPYFLELSPSASLVRSATSEKVVINAGQNYFFRVRAQRGTTLGSGSRLRFDVIWLGSNGTTVIQTDTITAAEQTPSTLTAGALPKQISWSKTAPASSYYVQVKPYTPALSSSSGTLRVEGPWISIVDPGGIPTIGYGPDSYAVKYSAAGVVESGELSADLAYILYLSGVAQTTGVTWTYKVITGTVNTFTSASGVKSMSGTGTGTFTLSSLGTDTASVEITGAAANGSQASKIVTFEKQYAAATGVVGGGGSSGDTPAQTSGFSSFSSTSFVAVTNELTYTIPSGQTSATVTVNLSANPAKSAGNDGSWTVEMKVQREISSVWTDQGSTFSGTSDLTTDDGSSFQFATPASISGTRQSTSLSASTQYKWRVVARITSGTKSHSVTGSVSVAAP